MKTVVITGAGGNLGAAASHHFLGKGWRVLAFVSPGKVPGGKKDNLTYVEADLMDEAGTAEVLASVMKKHPVIDAAILTVGGFEAGGLEQTDDAALRRMYALNFETAYHVARPLSLWMNRQPEGGRIIFIGARPALDASAGKSLVAYGLSKSLLFKLAEYMDSAFVKVKAHVVVFSALDTPQNRASMPKADRSQWVAPERVAELMEEVVTRGGNEIVEIRN
ncbi:MAG: SDR family NAD(P)-dependent oxidoreductase [Cyclobacteriaceae bacterium]|nr:SDR family NAD(P)-dependent oxidoreductase [Cyclobacteriaceae bacterium]